ncbi:type II toxin-antitoxin system VapC family toxin [Natrarchaeobius sp. A-rgal3]|uniref:type II toxin-antitoxin system VapC family toxin n=1 Tax=Natrarchaeobius versutus TaxID=1679078 RepID=UPI003510428C
MTVKLLDTTFLIHHWGGYPEVKSYLESQPNETEYITTTLNLKEIAVGRKLVGRFNPEEIRAQFEWVRTVPITSTTAWEIADVEAPLHRDETTNRDRINALAADAVVAGAAIEHEATVVSNNVDDFRALGVPVESYR